MLTLGIILTCLNGILLTALVGSRFSWTERIGLSFPLGMTLQTIIMALLDLLHIPLTASSVLLGGLLLFALLLFVVWRFRGIDCLRLTPAMLDDWRQANLVWVLLLLIIGYCEYMNFSKCIFFPPSDRDSLAAFDTLGFVAAHDHTYMRMSLFDADYNPSIHRAGGSIAYAPFVQLSYAYVYLLGAETSKAIPALMYLFFVVAFYGILRRNTGKTLAALATLFMMMAPEMLAFSSLSATNVMQYRQLAAQPPRPRTLCRSLAPGGQHVVPQRGHRLHRCRLHRAAHRLHPPQELPQGVVLHRPGPAPGRHLVCLHEGGRTLHRGDGHHPPLLGR